MANDSNLKGVYETLKREGYTPPEYNVFVKEMQDDHNLRGVHATLTKEGYTPPAYDQFKVDMFGQMQTASQSAMQETNPQGSSEPGSRQGFLGRIFSEAEKKVKEWDAQDGFAGSEAEKKMEALRQQAAVGNSSADASALGSEVDENTTQGSAENANSAPGSVGNGDSVQGSQQGWKPTERERIRMAYDRKAILDKFNDRSRERLEETARLMEPLSDYGRRKLKAKKFQTQVAGAPTQVLGITPPPSKPEGEENQTQEGEGLAPTGLSPVPYGVKYEDGKPVTEWLLPDGTLTTRYSEADAAEFSARNVRLRDEFVNRMKENGLDPAKQEDVERQAQLDAEAPMRRKRAELERRRAEVEERIRELNAQKEKEINESPTNNFPLPAGAVQAPSYVTGATKSKLDEEIENAMLEWETLGKSIDEFDRNRRASKSGIVGSIFGGLKDALTDMDTYTGIAGAVARNRGIMRASENMEDSDAANDLIKSYVKSRQMLDEQVAMGETPKAWYQGGHFVGEMTADPFTYVSLGLGSAAEKITAKALVNAGKRSVEKNIAQRLLLSNAGKMAVSKSAGGAANFFAFEGLGDIKQQLTDGGWYDEGYKDEHGNWHEPVFHEGFSWGHALKRGGHGFIMGSVMGAFGAGIGNAGTYLTRSIKNTAGKVAARGTQHAVGVLGEGTIFAMPEIIEFHTMDDDKFDTLYADKFGYADEPDPEKRRQARSEARDSLGWDAWTQSQANIFGMKLAGKAMHPMNAVRDVISRLHELRGKDKAHGLSFSERVDRMMDRSPFDVGFTEDERQELRDAGYGEVEDLFSRGNRKRGNSSEAGSPQAAMRGTDARETSGSRPQHSVGADYMATPGLRIKQDSKKGLSEENGVDGYELVGRLMEDKNISQSARAKAYFILTGNMLPQGTVVGYDMKKLEDGRIQVRSVTADEETVTSRIFKDEKSAEGEIENICRQAELNAVEAGEYVAENYKEGLSEKIRAEIEKETGIDVDKVLSKRRSDRSDEECNALMVYLKELYSRAKTPEEQYGEDSRKWRVQRDGRLLDFAPEWEEAEEIYAGGREIYERFEEGDETAGAEADAASFRMQEAYEGVDDAFGAGAEEYLARLEKDPWDVLRDAELTPDQRDAVLYFINSKAALEGVMDASNEAADRKRAEVRQEVEKRTHKVSKVIQPAVLKIDDKPVYIVSGEVAMFPDGSGVDSNNSSSVIYYVDESGEYKPISPDQIKEVGEAIDPEIQLQSAYDVIEQERQGIFSEDSPEMSENIEGEAGEVGENSVTSQHGNGSEQDNDGSNDSSRNDGGRVAADPAGIVEGDRDRSDIRVYEEGLGSSRNEHSEYSERARRNAEAERLTGIAKQNGQYLPREEIRALGKRYPKGTGESEVIIDHENGRVFKIKDPYAKSPMKGGVQPEDAVYEHLIHNKYFPETRYQFEGISDDLGGVRIVLSQDYVDAVDNATDEQIEAALAEKGLYPEGNYRYGNDEVSVTDVTGDNALLGADGKVYFIDPVIDFKKPVKEILGEGSVEAPIRNNQANVEEIDVSGVGAESMPEAETALSRIPVDEQTGEPRFEEAEAEHTWDALVESGAEGFADSRLRAAEKSLKSVEKLRNDETEFFRYQARKKEIDQAREEAQRSVDYWNSVKGVGIARAEEAKRAEAERLAAEEREAQLRAEEEREAEESWKAQKARIDKKLRKTAEIVKDCEEAVAVLEDLAPRDIWEAASVVLSGNKLIPRNDGVKKGFREMTGYKSGEQRKLVGLFAKAENEGKTLEKLAEDAMEEECNIYGIPYDNSEALNALLEVLQGCGTVGDIRNYIINNRMNEALSIHDRWLRDQEWSEEDDQEYMDYLFYQDHGISREEYEQILSMYDAYMDDNLENIDVNFDSNEFYGNIADELAARGIDKIEDGNRQGEIIQGELGGKKNGSGDGSSGTGEISGSVGELLPDAPAVQSEGMGAHEAGSGIHEEDGLGVTVPPSAVSAESPRGQVLGESPAGDGVSLGERIENNKPKFDRAVPATPEEQRSAIARIIDFAKKVKNRVERAVIGGITERQARDFAENGIDVDGSWVHSFESSAVAHNLKQHGNSQIEERTGQIAITTDDYARIPVILESYDRVTKSPNRSRSTRNDVIIYEKDFEDGYIYYLEEKRDNRKSLAFQTMYKKRKETDSSDGLMPVASPSTPIAPSDNLRSFSGSKDNTLSSDKQGNPIDYTGKLIVEDVKSIEEISDEDFTHPKRTIGLPSLPEKVSDAIGADGRKPIIKLNIFNKNRDSHKDLSPEDSRKILNEVLYNPDLYGQNKKENRPYNWILVHLADKNSSVIVEVNPTKDNLEIVNWHYLSGATLERKKRQAIKEGGRILTLSHDNAAANTQDGLSYDHKDNALSSDKQGVGKESYESAHGEAFSNAFEKYIGFKENRDFDIKADMMAGCTDILKDFSRGVPEMGRDELDAVERDLDSLVDRVLEADEGKGWLASDFVKWIKDLYGVNSHRAEIERDEAFRSAVENAEELSAKAPRRRKVSIGNFVDPREGSVLGGVYHDPEMRGAIASDSRVLVISHNDFDERLSGKTVVKGGETDSRRYPNVGKVIPSEDLLSWKSPVDFGMLEALAEDALRKDGGGRKDAPGTQVVLKSGNGDPAVVDAGTLRNFAAGARNAGATDFGVYRSEVSPNFWLMAKGDNGLSLLLGSAYDPTKRLYGITLDGDATNSIAEARSQGQNMDTSGASALGTVKESEGRMPKTTGLRPQHGEDGAWEGTSGSRPQHGYDSGSMDLPDIAREVAEGYAAVREDAASWMRGSDRNQPSLFDFDFSNEGEASSQGKDVTPQAAMRGTKPQGDSHMGNRPKGPKKVKTNLFDFDFTEEEKALSVDNQGNPIDHTGKLIVEDVKSIDEISDDDFTNPKRTVGIPSLPQNVTEAIGSNGRNVIIKKSIFEKNRDNHSELSPNDSRDILKRALFNPSLVGATQPIKRPDYKVAIQTGDKNAVVVLDIYAGKDNVEIVGWRKVDSKGLEKMKRQAEREGGQFLILSPSEGSAAALSALPSDVSYDHKDNALSGDRQVDGKEKDDEGEGTSGSHPQHGVETAKEETSRTSPQRGGTAVIEDFGEKIAGARKDLLRDLSRNLENVNVESLVKLPLGKVMKRPDFGRMVEKGAMTPAEAAVAEAMWQTVYSSRKPTATPRNKRSILSWAEDTAAKIKDLEEFINADGSRRREIMDGLEEVSYPDRDREAVKFQNIQAYNPDKRFDAPLFTPSGVWVNSEVMNLAGSVPGDGTKIECSVRPNLTYQYYDIFDASGLRIRGVGAKRDLRKALEDMALVVRSRRGDRDIVFPADFFRVVGVDPIKEETGEFEVVWLNSGYNVERSVHADRESAEKKLASLLAKKKTAKINPRVEHKGYRNYEIHFRNPISEEVVTLEERYPDAATASQAISDGVEGLSESVNAVLSERDTQKGKSSKKDHYNVVSVYNRTGRYYAVYRNNVGRKVTPWGGEEIKRFDSLAEAHSWFDENKDRLEREYAEMIKKKREFVFFKQTSNPRKGTDYRGGRDVTPDVFSDTFGFRGVQFGNWTNGADRQAALNEAYDALRDLAGIIGVDPRRLSLNGELGLAFGSRGSGNANAHYEPKEVVINLTKTRGAGSLAHEWWHALDNYLMRRNGVAYGYATEHMSGDSSMRSSVAKAVSQLVTAVRGSDYDVRSDSQGEYWGSIIEETARLFGEWVVSRQEKRGERNYFLSRGIDPDVVGMYRDMTYANYKAECGYSGEKPMSLEEWSQTKESLGSFPYPTSEEIRDFDPLVRNVFDALRETDFEGLPVEELAMEPSGGYAPGLFKEKTGMNARQLSLFDDDLMVSVNPEAEVKRVDDAVDSYCESFAEVFGYPEDSIPEDVLDKIWDSRESLRTTLEEYFRNQGNSETDARDRAREMIVTLQAQVSVAELKKQGRVYGDKEAGISDGSPQAALRGTDTQDETSGSRPQQSEGEVVSRETAGGDILNYRHEGLLPELGKGHFSLMERVFSETGEFRFSGDSRIESADDVAYMFRNLESKSIENSFAVLTKDGVPVVVHLGMGTAVATIANIQAIKAADNAIGGADRVWFVHNHPSGNLNHSPQDMNLHNTLVDMLGDKMEPSIIMDTLKGEYSEFGDFGGSVQNRVHPRPKSARETENGVRVYRFDDMVYSDDFDFSKLSKVSGSHDVASLLSGYRLGSGAKAGVIVLSQSGNIVANLPCPHLLDSPEGVDAIVNYAIHGGGQSVIVYGNEEMSGVKMRRLGKEIRERSGNSIKLLDVMTMLGKDYRSGVDMMLMEPDEMRYGNGSSEDGVRFRDGEVGAGDFKLRDGENYGERLRAIRALDPIEVEPNTMSRAELREVYDNLPAVDKDGREIEFYHSAFKKIYKDGGLFGQVVPVLDDVLRHSVLAYSEEDNLGGMVRPDGTVHKEHENVLSFDNYIGKVRLGEKDYYIRATVQQEKNQSGTHSFFVSNVDVYENPTESRTIPITSRGTTDFDGIVDAKLQQFFERASSEALELDKKDRVNELSEKLGVPVRMISNREDIDNLPSARQRRSKGYWSSEDGVVVIMPNNSDVADLDNTVVHEVVGHKGLRAFIGAEHFDRFLGEVFDHAAEPIRKRIMQETDRLVGTEAARMHSERSQAREGAGEDVNANYYADMAQARLEAEKRREEYRKEATEEYMSDLGGRIGSEGFEKMSREELTLWSRIKAKVQQFLDRFLQGLNIPRRITLSDKDLAYILYKSWKNLRDGADSEKGGSPQAALRGTDTRETSGLRPQHGVDGGIFAEAEDVAMMHRTGWDAGLDARIKAENAMGRANDRFNRQLNRYINGKMTTQEYIEVGQPLGAMRLFLSDIPIVVRQRVLHKASETKHHINLTELQNLPAMLAEPIFVFQRNPNTLGVLTELTDKNGKNICVAIELNRSIQSGSEILEVNDIRSLHGRDAANIVLPIAHNNTLRYANKEKGLAWLSSASSNYQQEIASQDLKSATNIVKTFENPKYDEEAEIRFRDPDMGLEETITKMKAEAMRANADNLQAKHEAMRAIGGNLTHLRQAMARQREYDVQTAKSVTDLARVLMENGLLDDLSRYETKRLLGIINGVIGRQDVSQHVQKVMDIMVDNQLRSGANAFGKLLSVRGSRVDARGVEVQGVLDPDGQRIAQVVKKSTKLPKDDIENRMAEAMDRMSSTDSTIADEAAIEYAGLQIAHQYVEDITESKAQEQELRDSIKKAKEEKDAGQMTATAYKQYVDATNDAIRQNKIERAEAYQSLVEQVGGVLNESVARAKAWRDEQKSRVDEIHHNANSDMEGRPADEHHKDNRIQKIANNSLVRFVFAPLATFDQMLRMFGNKNSRGEGYLWNRFMRDWVDATEKEYKRYRDALKVLDDKVKEVFAKAQTGDKKIGAGIKSWGDLFALDRKLPKATVRFRDGGEMKDHVLTQGNLLYIYMADKMSDGRMKLRKMGITEEDVEDIRNFLDPRFIQLADWMQEEFLVDKRNEYNEVHKRMFGASMAAIENYFPLKILANARMEDVDVAEETTETALPATSTGSIIKRRRNNLALDVTGANAFSVILDHVQQMERWAAFAEFNRDLNTLLSYKRFRNQVMNMSSVYGAGKTLWNNFRNVCSMAAGTYRPPIAALDKAAVNIAKGVTAAKVSFRIFTALKQFLSMPAYISDCNPIRLASNLVNPAGAWKWSMENLPIFEKRWKSRMAGDPRLMKTDMDWKMWRSRIVELASRVGMSPNAFVDALTVSIGAHSMYQTKLAKYKRQGYDPEIAEKKAKQDATILFNQTQQSSEDAFLSTMQVDRSWLSVLFTVFRNSSMSYTRQLYDAVRNISRVAFKPGYKNLSVDFMAKQMAREGIDPDKATGNAKRAYRRGIIRDLVRVGIFGAGLQFAWNLGAYLPYLILGDDEDEKGKMWDDVNNHTVFGSIEGLTGGDVMSAAGNMLLSGEGNPQNLTKDMPLASDVLSILKKLGDDQVSAMNDVINLCVQSGLGVNPQSLTDAVTAVMDYCGDDAQSARECALLIARVLNCPQSQIDKIYFDELDASAREASKMAPNEIIERFARYKVRRGAPLTGWAFGNEQREKIMDKYRKRGTTVAKERLAKETAKVAEPKTAAVLEEFNKTRERMNEIRKVRDQDIDRYYDLLDELESSPEFERYLIVKSYKHDIDDITKRWLNATTPAESDSCARAILSRNREMLEEVRQAQ